MAAAVYFARPTYRHFKEKHSLARAEAFFKQGDYRSAVLSARQTLLVNSNNLQACRLMANISDMIHAPATLDWCRRAVEIDPTVENKLLLAAAGLRYQSPPYPLTAQILGELAPSADGQVAFQLVSAELALQLNRMDDAAAHFEAASKLDPTNQFYQMELAVIRLGSTNPAVAAGGQSKLEQFRADTNLAPVALRALAADRLRRDDPQRALNFIEQLLKMPQATVKDRLEYLGILRRLKSPELAAQLTSLQLQSETNALMANDVVSWMEANGLLAEAIHWLTNQPASFQSQTPVRQALVDCYLNSGDWKSLREFLSNGNWGDMECLRLAYLSRTWKQLGDWLAADGDWRAAVNEADNRLGALNALLQLAIRWDMKPQQEDLLWRIVQEFPDARWAGNELARLYSADGNTDGLRQLYSRLLANSPDNARDKNNLALTSMLLKTNLNQAFQWAEQAHAQSPDAATASTYAYALQLQNRTRDGLAVLQKLPANDLEQPAVALYYGSLLNAAGETNEAAHFLAIAANKDDRLLPEEKRLLLEAGGK